MLFRAENQQSCERCVRVPFLLCEAVLASFLYIFNRSTFLNSSNTMQDRNVSVLLLICCMAVDLGDCRERLYDRVIEVLSNAC